MKILANIICGVALATLCGAAQASTTIDFDDATAGRFTTFIEDDYTITKGPQIKVYGDPSYITIQNGIYLRDKIMAMNYYWDEVSDITYFDITSDQEFSFTSFDGVAVRQLKIMITGYNNGVEQYKKTYDLTNNSNDQGYIFETFEGVEGAVDRLTFSGLAGSGGGMYVDDIVLNEVAAAVPEPSTWALMLAGFGMVGASLRRRRERPAVLA